MIDDRIKVGYYVHEWNYAGTARSHERIIAGLDSSKFKPYVFYWNACNTNTRLSDVKSIVEDKNGEMVPFSRSNEKSGPEGAYTPLTTDFHLKVEELGLDIMHVGRGGHNEWPFNRRMCPVQMETNIFGDNQADTFLDWSIPISNWVMARRGRGDAVVYNPIPEAVLEGDNLREELNIPEDALVCGRIGRPGNWSKHGLEGFKAILNENPNSYYIIVSPCPEDLRVVENERIPNVVFVGTVSDDKIIEKFHRTIDIFLHYRSDGETFGTAIAQAMSYGIPVVSHDSPVYNAQEEVIGDGGFVATFVEGYADYATRLVDPEVRRIIGARARNMFLMNYLQENIVRRYEREYLLALRKFGEKNA